jgi:hypothetical protein
MIVDNLFVKGECRVSEIDLKSEEKIDYPGKKP